MIESIDEGWEIMTYSSGNLSRQSSLIDLVRDCAGKFLACTVQTNTEKTTWRAGGRLWTAWNLLGNYHLTDSWELKLEYPRLITVPLIKNNTYALFYEPPKWFLDYKITIWENKNMALYTDNTIQIPSYTSSTAAVTNITVSNNAAAISMRISQAGIELIKKWEGCRTDAYLCPAGIWTIGYGHTASAIPGMTINQLEAENLLKVDLERFEVAVCRLVKVQLTQNQFDALVSFTYNVGAEAFRKSTLLVRLNANQLQAAAKQFRRWVTANGKELPGLVKRRKEEESLFLNL